MKASRWSRLLFLGTLALVMGGCNCGWDMRWDSGHSSCHTDCGDGGALLFLGIVGIAWGIQAIAEACRCR